MVFNVAPYRLIDAGLVNLRWPRRQST